MRILFLHAAWNGLTSEYNVHTTLATNAKKEAVDPYFIWQSPISCAQIPADRLIPHEFGRNMALTPKPGRVRRAGLIMQHLPEALAFLNATCKRIRPDIIYTSQQAFDVRLAQIVSRHFHVPHVIHIHYSVGPWLGAYTLNTIRKSPCLIAVSEYIRQTALLQGVPSSSIYTVVNPVPALPAQRNPAAPTIRSAFHIEPTAPLIVAVGRLDPMKGHLALFEAFARVIRQIPQAHLLLCGTSTTRDNYELKLRHQVNALNLTAHVTFAGHRDDIAAILQTADVFCLPSELEPFGLVFLEAMMAGIPVVAYHSGGVPEIVLHHETGLLSYPNDRDALAANLIKVLADPDYAHRLGQAGKQRAATEFTPAGIAEHWLQVLQRRAYWNASPAAGRSGVQPRYV